MPRIQFRPSLKHADVDSQTKILVSGRKAGVDIRFGCAACRCGTCAVRVSGGIDQISGMSKDEEKLLTKLKQPLDGSIRLACQARIVGDCEIDLGFQDDFSPDIGFDDDDE